MKPWNNEQIALLKTLWGEKEDWFIAWRVGRSEAAVRDMKRKLLKQK